MEVRPGSRLVRGWGKPAMGRDKPAMGRDKPAMGRDKPCPYRIMYERPTQIGVSRVGGADRLHFGVGDWRNCRWIDSISRDPNKRASLLSD